MLRPEHCQTILALGCVDSRRDRLRKLKVISNVSSSYDIGFIHFIELTETVLSDRFQQPITRRAFIFGHQDQRLINEMGKQVEHICPVNTFTRANLLDRFQRTLAGEYRKAPL
jgi:hypothetical protein